MEDGGEEEGEEDEDSRNNADVSVHCILYHSSHLDLEHHTPIALPAELLKHHLVSL